MILHLLLTLFAFAMTNARKAAVLDSLYGSGTPATYHVGLSSTTPAADGTNFTEPAEASYARVAVTNDATNWPAATVADPSVQSNGTVITFPEAAEAWAGGANLTHWGLFTAATGGTPVDTAALTTPKPVVAGDTPRFGVGALVTRLQGA